MGIRSTKRNWMKIGEENGFSVYRNLANPNLFQVRLRNSEHFIRRHFRAVDAKRALEKAPQVLGPKPSRQERAIIDLVEAFSTALGNASRGEKAQGSWFYYVERFMRWLRDRCPNCTHWGALTRQILREYLDTYRGKSANTRRLALQPVVQTAGFMEREFGFQNVAHRLNIGSKLKSTPKVVYLDDVLNFCDWVAGNRPRLEPGVALQGLAGLQLQEALRLTWDGVDLERGLIEISGEVKNEYRKRVIPVAERVLHALKHARQRKASSQNKAQPIQEHVVLTS